MPQPNYLKNTQFVFIASKLLNSSLGAMYGLLAFILCKQCHATPLQITLLVSSKPLVAIVSFYGFLFIKNKPHRLKTLIIASTLLSFIPCFLFPFISTGWFFIFAFALFMMSARAMLPAWSEVFKLNIEAEKRGAVFSKGSTINYLSNIGLPLLIAPIMDYYPPSWKWIFFGLAFIQLLDLIILAKLKINFKNQPSSENSPSKKSFSIHSLIVGPWKNSWNLMKFRPDFRNYQIVFMFGGTGLILAHPVLPIFFEQVLHLSYTEMAFAVSVCKGIGFALTSPVWAKWFNRISIHLFNFHVTAFAGIFALLFVWMNNQVGWVYLAYFIYGVMQAGSELSWNLAGPRFAKNEDSTLFTSVNVAMVGLRGCVAPFFGQLLFLSSNFTVVFLCSALFCFSGAFYSAVLEIRNRKSAQIISQII
ncbi:MAG: MFS transporter [Candidatus Protochlamydia sp.]|nr:MFS transporter [Candidatus Protochlamydia sp.]